MPERDQQRGPPEWASGLDSSTVRKIIQDLSLGTPLVSVARQYGLEDRFAELREWLRDHEDQHSKYAAIEAQRVWQHVPYAGVVELFFDAWRAAGRALATEDQTKAWLVPAFKEFFTVTREALILVSGLNDGDGGRSRHIGSGIRLGRNGSNDNQLTAEGVGVQLAEMMRRCGTVLDRRVLDNSREDMK